MTTSRQLETAREDTETRGPKCHLTNRLLARDQQSASARPNQSIDQLKHERRLADPWLARQQRDSARNQAASNDPVDFGEPRGEALDVEMGIRQGRDLNRRGPRRPIHL